MLFALMVIDFQMEFTASYSLSLSLTSSSPVRKRKAEMKSVFKARSNLIRGSGLS